MSQSPHLDVWSLRRFIPAANSCSSFIYFIHKIDQFGFFRHIPDGVELAGFHNKAFSGAQAFVFAVYRKYDLSPDAVEDLARLLVRMFVSVGAWGDDCVTQVHKAWHCALFEENSFPDFRVVAHTGLRRVFKRVAFHIDKVSQEIISGNMQAIAQIPVA